MSHLQRLCAKLSVIMRIHFPQKGVTLRARIHEKKIQVIKW